MIPSTNGNSAPKGCNPISSNCVIWQGPDLPCIDLCTGDSISAVLAKLCEELVNLTTPDDSCCDVTELSPGCLQDAYPDNSFESMQDYINALTDYVCNRIVVEGGDITINQTSSPIVRIPSCVLGKFFIRTANTVVVAIDNPSAAAAYGVVEVWQEASQSAVLAYNAYLDEAADSPGFTLNTSMMQTEFMVLDSNNPDLYSLTTGVWAGNYSGWSSFIGNAICQLTDCAYECLSSEPTSSVGVNTDSVNPIVGDRKPSALSKANKQIIERMIDNKVKKSTINVPKVVPKYVTNKVGKAVDMNVLLTALEKEFGLLRNSTGTATDMRNAITAQPMNLNSEDALNGKGTMGLLPGWYTNPNNLSESIVNAWMTIADLRNAVIDIQKNYLGTTTCKDIKYGVKGYLNATGPTVNGIDLDFSETEVKAPFYDCDKGCKVTIEDSDFTTLIKYLNVSSISNSGNVFISFQNSRINKSSNYKVTVDMCFTDGDSQCAKTTSFTIENNQKCPTVQFTGTDTGTIAYQITGVDGSSYDLTLVCESFSGQEYGRNVYPAPASTLTGRFVGLESGKAFNIYAELKSKGSGVTTKCPAQSVATTTPLCTTSHIKAIDYKSSFSEAVGAHLRIACYNDTVSTHSTLLSFDTNGDPIIIKCTDDDSATCTGGESITTYGDFIGNTSSKNLIIGTSTYPSSLVGEEGSGWKYVNTIGGPQNRTYYVYALVNKNSNSIDEVVISCDCALFVKNDLSMNYCKSFGTTLCKVDLVGFSNTSIKNAVEITSVPSKGSVSYDEALSTHNQLVFTYSSTSANTDWTSDSFKFRVANTCGVSSETIIPITKAKEAVRTTGDVYVYVNTTDMSYTDAVDLKATFEAVKVKMQDTCKSWTGTIYYIPVDSTAGSGNYLNYPKSLVDMRAGAAGSITLAGGTWASWMSKPSYWTASSIESVPSNATIFAFTNLTSTNADYSWPQLSDGWLGQPTAQYQNDYEEFVDLMTGTQTTAWGTSNGTAVKYFGTDGANFRQILVPIMKSKTGETAAAALQMLGAITGSKLTLAEVNGIKVGDNKYPVDLNKYLLESSSEAKDTYTGVTSANNITIKGLKDYGFTIASWLDSQDDISTNNEKLQKELMATIALDPDLSLTNCATEAECGFKMLGSGIANTWAYSSTSGIDAGNRAIAGTHIQEVWHNSDSTIWAAGGHYKTLAGACLNDPDSPTELETGWYAENIGSRRFGKYTKGGPGVAGTWGSFGSY